MKAATHPAFAGLTGVIASGFGAGPSVPAAVALGLGALLPDIDTTTSGIGKWVKPLSGYLEQRFGHRTITHSFLGLLALALVSSPLLIFAPSIWVWLLVGVLTHILLDTLNVMGVPLLWPLQF